MPGLSLNAILLSAVALLAPSVEAVDAGRHDSELGAVEVTPVVGGLAYPWAVAFLPDNQGILVTERPGSLRFVSPEGQLSAPLEGVPRVFASGQGGLLDVALSPGFAEDRLVYLTYAEAGEDGRAGTAAGRGRLSADKRRLEGFHVIFRQLPKLSSGHHFGSRLVFDGKGHLFIALGENNQRSTSQDLDKLQGKIVPPVSGRRRSQGQSLRRPCRRAARDLELWPPQPAGRRAESLDRPALDPRARPARRRRDQHTPGRRELRLAAGDPWNQLHPAADPRSQGQGR